MDNPAERLIGAAQTPEEVVIDRAGRERATPPDASHAPTLWHRWEKVEWLTGPADDVPDQPEKPTYGPGDNVKTVPNEGKHSN